MLTVDLKKEGPLFSNPKGKLKKAIDNCLYSTANYAKGLIQSQTPVKTGRLKNGFTSTKKGFEVIVDNQVFYAPFVEAKVQMVARSQPQIEAYLEDQLLNKVTDLLE